MSGTATVNGVIDLSTVLEGYPVPEGGDSILVLIADEIAGEPTAFQLPSVPGFEAAAVQVPGTFPVREEGYVVFRPIPAGTAAWTGAAGSDWSNTANSNTGTIPNQETAVTIRANAPNQPTITSQDAAVANLTVESRATLTIGDGRRLSVFGSVDGFGPVTGAGTLSFEGTDQLMSGTFTTVEVSGSVAVYGAATMQVLSLLAGSSIDVPSATTLTVSTVFNNLPGSLITGGGTIDASTVLDKQDLFIKSVWYMMFKC